MPLDSVAGAIDLRRMADSRSTGRILRFGAVGGAFLFLLFGAMTLALSLREMERGFEQVGHTERVLRHAAAFSAQIGTADAASRGYMLAAEASFLARLNRARAGMARELAALRALTDENPQQMARLLQMERRLQLHLGRLAEALAPGDPQLAALSVYLRTNPSLRMVPEIDTALSKFRDAEFSALRERQARSARDAKYAMAVSLLAVLLALLSGGAGLYLIVRERGRVELRKLQEEFAHVSRLNTMGEVAAMLAHEVKQPLTASSNYLSVVRRQLANEEVARDKIGETVVKISAQVGRAVDIIQRLRGYVASAGPAAEAEGVAGTIGEAIALGEIGRDDLAIGLDIEDGLPPVLVDKVQIQQVLVNLMRNASEAMARSPVKSLVIAARRDGERMIRIEVRDSGPGLPEQVRENLFRPFVSTKESGMGVGLSICRSIVQAHGGRIGADGGPDGGTVFYFTLPQA